MTKFTPRIGWIKWKNPYSNDEIEGEDDKYDRDNDDNVTLYKDGDEDNIITQKNTRAILTPMGVLPLPEHSAAQNVFSLWTAHTNFDINNKIAEIVELTPGVETLQIFTRYRMNVGIGKLFSIEGTIKRINDNILKSFND